MTKCNIVQYGDLTECETCGLRWDTNDPNPPACGGNCRCDQTSISQYSHVVTMPDGACSCCGLPRADFSRILTKYINEALYADTWRRLCWRERLFSWPWRPWVSRVAIKGQVDMGLASLVSEKPTGIDRDPLDFWKPPHPTS